MRRRDIEWGGAARKHRAGTVVTAGLALIGLGGGCYTGLDLVDQDGVDPQPEQEDAGDDEMDPWEQELGDCDPTAVRRSTLRRLNRREYRNTVRDLLQLEALPEFALPIDELSSQGLDNDGDTLSLDLAGAERYYDAAVAISADLDQAGARPLAQCEDLSGSELSTCFDEGLPAWLRRAFRHPAPEDALDVLGPLLQDVQTYDEGAQAITLFTLTSPHFLFHYKALDDDGSDMADPYELAGRVSYLLWSSMPDDTLMDAAADGSLIDRDELEAQVERMLADDRSGRFYADFSAVWLKLDTLDSKPDAQEFPELFADMRTETRLNFQHLGQQGAPINDLLRSTESWINGRLAEHYGVAADLADDEWEPVSLPDSERAGLLTQGSVLAASAGSEFSDPIRRGAWIAETMACLHPPSPPPDVPDLPEPSDDQETIRELLERHTSDPTCAACHKLMDPYGMALENYDRMGVFRTEYDNGAPVDASGTLLSGAQFDNAVELSGLMLDDGQFEDCVGSVLSAYSAGRALDGDEQCFVELAIEQAREQRDELSFDDMLVALITSYLFVSHGGAQ